MSRILQINTPLGADNTVLVRLSSQEALGRLPEYQMTLVSKRGRLGAADLLGKNVTAGMEMPDGQAPRYFNGYITAFSDDGSAPATWFDDNAKGQVHQYRLTVHPWLWFLTRSAGCRIFQKKTVVQVVKAVCDGYPFAELSLSMLSGQYAQREYICQYRETDFNFVLRLLEQEGIYFGFRHDNGKHTMVLYDNYGAHAPRPHYTQVAFDDAGGHGKDSEHLASLYASLEVQPGRYALSDFDFRKPKVDLQGVAGNPLKHDLDGFEFFDHPGEYESVAEGAAYARIRLEEVQARHAVLHAGGPVRGMEAGCTFKLAGHPHQERNQDYLVTSVHYSITNNVPASAGGGGGDVHCELELLASRTQFRPARTAPRPLASGPQTAIVVGPAGEELHVDELGRVKLQFHWDRHGGANENSSCWVRVSQPWASKGWGALFLPRIGQEVIVEFLDGDPDHPIIVGRVYNGDATPPWALPREKTRSGIRTRTEKGGAANFNELSFDDKLGHEEMFIQAERDQVLNIKHDRIEEIGNERHVKVGKDAFEALGGDSHLKITGDQNTQADGSVSLKLEQDWQAAAGGKFAVQTGSEVHLKAGSTVVIEASSKITFKVGGNFIVIDGGGVAIKGMMVQVNSGGSPGSGSGAAPIPPKPPRAPRTSQGGSDEPPPRHTKPAAYSPQAMALKLAWKTGTPFCAKCEAAKAAHGK